REAEFEGHAHALLRPRLQLEREGVADHDQHAACLVAEGHALPLQGFGERDQVEGRVELVQALHRQRREAEDLAQHAQEFRGLEAELLFEDLDHAPARARRLVARARELRGREQRLGGKGELGDRVHWMLPASSNTGRYISTTMTPMTMPMKAISSGSN